MALAEYLELLPVPVAIHRQGKLLYANKACISLLNAVGIPGRQSSDFAELDLFSLIAVEQRASALKTYSETLRKGETRRHVNRTFVATNGTRYELTATIKSVEWEGVLALEIAIVYVDPLLSVEELDDDEQRRRRELLSGLTEREKTVAQLVAKGFTTTNISELLGISENTVRNHLRAAFSKTQTHSRTELSRLLWGL